MTHRNSSRYSFAVSLPTVCSTQVRICWTARYGQCASAGQRRCGSIRTAKNSNLRLEECSEASVHQQTKMFSQVSMMQCASGTRASGLGVRPQNTSICLRAASKHPAFDISASGLVASFPSLSSHLHRRANLGAGASAVSGMVKKRTPFNLNVLFLRCTRRLAAAMSLSAMSCAGTKAGGARSSAGPSSMAVETTSNAPTSTAPADASAPPAQAGK